MSAPLNHPPRPDGWEREIYPMPAFPLLTAADVDRASRWYQETLGFVDVFTFRDPEGRGLLAHLRWCKYGDVLIGGPRGAVTAGGSGGVTIVFAEQDVDALAERIRGAGGTVEGPTNTPWNTRDITVYDLDGYRLRFTASQPGRAPESFDKVVERVSKGV